MRIAGESIFSLRLTSAFVGIVTVAVTYWLGLELTRDRRIALLAAALLAISFWHVLFSRLGFRAISQPLLQALTVAALFRGLRLDSWRWIVAGGVALGLTAYTYLAARIFPIPLALALLPFIFDRPNRRRHLWQLGMFLAGALVILAPLAIYFFTNQDAFLVRVNQVLPQEASPAGLAIGYLKSLGMLFLAGDPYSRFNIPGRPLFDWFWGALLIVGWIYALLRWRRQPQVGQRAGYLLLAILPFFMLLPYGAGPGRDRAQQSTGHRYAALCCFLAGRRPDQAGRGRTRQLRSFSDRVPDSFESVLAGAGGGRAR